MTGKPDEDGFLSRWSRRKIEGAPEELPEVAPEPAPPEDAAETRSDAEILAELNLPDPDTLGPGDDFSGFLKASLPEHLRVRALRRLWRSNPVFAHLDGLNEYDGDFTGGGVPMGTLKTAYQVGKGFLKQVDEVASDVDAEEAPPRDETAPEDLALDERELDDTLEPPPLETAEITDADPKPEGDAPEGPTRRRMAFKFGDTS